MSGCCNNGLSGNVIVEKNVDKRNAVVGDILTYSIAVINQGDLMINDIVVIDTLPPSLEFVVGSVMLEGNSLPDGNVLTGVSIGLLAADAMKLITFKVKVMRRPNDCYINNTAIAKFKCVEMADCGVSTFEVVSNTIMVKVDLAEIKVIKQTDAKIISREDIVKFTVTLINVGTLEAKSILFTDIITEQDILIEDSFTVNGEPVSVSVEKIPGVGNRIQVFVGSLMPTEKIIITYEVKVMGINCRGYFVNKAYVTFDYNLSGDICGEKTSELDEESVIEIELGLSTFKQLSVDGYLTIPEVKPDIEEINTMTATADLISCHVIKTPISKSNEGQTLSGYKLIVKGMLDVVIEYTALDTDQSVHSAHYSIPFATFIVLPLDYITGSRVDVEFVVEDIYYKATDVRTFFGNITLLANVKVLSC